MSTPKFASVFSKTTEKTAGPTAVATKSTMETAASTTPLAGSAEHITDPTRTLRWMVYSILICLSVGWSLGRIGSIQSVEMVGIQKERIKKIPEELAKLRSKLENEQMPVKQADGSPQLQADGSPVMRPYTIDEIEEKLIRKETELNGKYAVLTRPFLSGNDRSRWCTVRALVEPDMRVEGAPYAIDKVIQQPGWDTIDMVKHDDHFYSSKPPLFPTVMAGAYWCVVKTTGWTLATHPFVVGRLLLVLFNLVPLVVYFVIMIALIERLSVYDWSKIFTVAVMVLGTLLSAFVVVINNHLPAAVSVALTLYALVRMRLDDDRRLRCFFVAGLGAALTASFELPGLAFLAAVGLFLLIVDHKKLCLAAIPAMLVVIVPYFATNLIAHDSVRLPYMHRSKTDPADNWYSYSYERGGQTVESYWDHPQGRDQGEPSRRTYALHCLVGHHGIFSLTPVWLLSFIGMGIWLCSNPQRMRLSAFLFLSLSLLVIGFYLMRPLIDRNYGGLTCGLRWTFWLIPFWLLSMLPTLDRMAASRWLRGFALLLLIVSVFSVVWPCNPWSDPWLCELLDTLPSLWG
ncbi:MAG: hypothetical protein PHE53_00970 [Thermoguttaceae bacterium]|nr:hypothetical protein [Thermoguttaceae bacterium]